MFNASTTLTRMFHSIAGQSYEDWKIILIDDVSSIDHASEQVKIIGRFQNIVGFERIQFIVNETKKWETANVLFGAKQCKSDDILVRLDADDYLTDLDALAIMDQVYSQTNCDLAWSMHRWGLTDRNISGPLPNGVDPYKVPWCTSHMKTCRRKLLDGVSYENFLNQNGELVKRAGDQAFFLPCLRNSKNRTFVQRVLYHYHIDEKDGAVYQTDDARFQREEAEFLRHRGYVASGISWENIIK
jgi:glycosyltransferase involved in cell wall biosynthesis